MEKQLEPGNDPLLYNPDFENPAKDDREALSDLLKGMADIRNKTRQDTGHAMRSVHVKSHGLLKGELKVTDNLPACLAQGVFARAASYPVIIRISSSPGDMLPDSVSAPKGFAIKVLDVPGLRVPGLPADTPQNFTFGSGGKTFQSKDIKAFGAGIKVLGATVDKGERMKVIASAVLRGIEKTIETVGLESATIKTLGGDNENHILGNDWYSATPFLYGVYMAKFALAPVSANLLALKNKVLHAGNNPNAIRDAVTDFFATETAVWEFRVQLCTDIDKMPVEDATVEWPETLSPYLTVATLTVKPQTAWSPELAAIVDDRMSFTPWECLAEHRPLGNINRARRPVYEQSADFRFDEYGK